MGIFDFLKKQPAPTLSPIPPPLAPLSRLDEKISKLPPLPQQSTTSTTVPILPPLFKPAPASPIPSMPTLPPLFKPAPSSSIPSMPTLPPLSKSELPTLPKLQTTLPPLPKLFTPADTKPVIPPLPKLSEFPTISVPKPVAPSTPTTIPTPTPMPKLFTQKPVAPAPTPTPAPVAPPLASLSRLQDLLSEITEDEFEEPKPLVATRPVSKKHGPIFVAVAQYEETIIDIKTMSQQFGELQAHNEKLGIIETHTKIALEGLISGFDAIQKQLLLIDEKLFKVN